jgi:glycosyltransferase involved in cell wall biosynthesis
MFFPVNLIGYVLEPVYLWLYRNMNTITVSNSTKRNLLQYMFKSEKVHVITQCANFAPISAVDFRAKFADPTVLTLGTIRPMKRTDAIIKAFEIAKEQIPNLKLKVAGMAVGGFGVEVLNMIKNSKFADSIEYVGRVNQNEKEKLMKSSHVFCMTSIKEGWGLTVTESASQGTPAAVYDIDGLRDSVIDGVTGLISKENTPESLADAIVGVVSDKATYEKFATEALENSRGITSEQSYLDFKKYAGIN